MSPLLLSSLNPAAIAAGDDIPNAITIDGETLSRSDLLGAATSVAERVAQARRVAVLAEPTVTTVLAVVGCLIAGVTVVPVPPDAGSAELAHILKNSGAQAWLGKAPECSELPVIPVRKHARSWHRYAEPSGKATAFILYTSGTTGLPKGVMLSRDAIAAGLDALTEAWQWTWKDTLVHGLPLFHVHGLILGMLGPLRVGSPLVHTGKPTPRAYARAHGTMYFGVPTVWSRIVEEPSAAKELAKARILISGSAPLPVPVFERLAELTGHAPIERYGMSETMITLSTRPDGERRPGWVGTPVQGVETRLRDEAGQPVPHDGESVGGLQVRGPMLFDGYLGKPEAAAENFTADGWFKTGDVAVIDAEDSTASSAGNRWISSSPAATASARARSRPPCSGIRRWPRLRSSGYRTTISDSASSPSWCRAPMPPHRSPRTSSTMWRANFRRTSGHVRCAWSKRCRAMPWARCRRNCCLDLECGRGSTVNRMTASLSQVQIEYLTSQRLGRLATIRPDGSP